jgi:hypothetical protein
VNVSEDVTAALQLQKTGWMVLISGRKVRANWTSRAFLVAPGWPAKPYYGDW